MNLALILLKTEPVHPLFDAVPDNRRVKLININLKLSNPNFNTT